ncbi:hypothetical protein [Pseudomonas sp. SR18]|uniref:hypothetical protein n=1 Tax=Pseudomonas sp. SR18 TaxID=1461074 RepID=UPI0020343818|nr:hypothetical protein [Pseudomonas sp. SR18]MCM2362448.1 hypothetical protein [Pseudomonas sp. SR18]
MTRTQVAFFVCSLYAVIGVFVGGGMRPMLMLAVITCGPLALHYLTNPGGAQTAPGSSETREAEGLDGGAQ